MMSFKGTQNQNYYLTFNHEYSLFDTQIEVAFRGKIWIFFSETSHAFNLRHKHLLNTYYF